MSSCSSPIRTISPERLDHEICQVMMEWVLGEEEACPVANLDPKWAVLQCFDGFVWCVWQDDIWLRADQAPNSFVRRPSIETLMEARLFGPTGEALIWRVHDRLQGRVLRTLSTGKHDPDPLVRLRSPLPRFVPFMAGSEREFTDAPFVRRQSGSGNVVVTPKGRGLKVLEHLEEDSETGILRIAATQFIDVC